ncbi:MAG: hypothetical protein ABJZ55_11915 [Fuerstiella sp.]
MKYQFRRGSWFDEERIELTASAVKLFRDNRKAKCTIPFASVSKIHGFSNMTAMSEHGQRFETHMCRIVPKKGPAIIVCSSSFIRHGSGNRQVATDNAEAYIRLIERLKNDIASANPDAVLIAGNRIASVMGACVATAAIDSLALTVALPFSGKPSLKEAWPLMLVAGLVCLVFFPWGIQMARAYAPKAFNLREAVRGVKQPSGGTAQAAESETA